MSNSNVKPNGRHYDYRTDPNLNSIQLAHMKGELNLYENIEAYKEQWYHKGDTYYPIPNTKVREDLPPIYIQWKDAYRKILKLKRNERGT